MVDFGPTIITKVTKETGSLMSFYDEIVYWEIARGTNRFFVTFEKGQGGIANAQRESIGTAELSYPNVTSFTSSGEILPGSNRNSKRFDIFLEGEEKAIWTNASNHLYQGFIPITELKGTKHFDTTYTSSRFIEKTYYYETHFNGDSYEAFRTVSASYFYPLNSYQMSVLRDTPSIIIDLDKEGELPQGMGERGFVIIPEHTHPKVTENLEYYLRKGGVIKDNVSYIKDKNQIPEKGGGPPLEGGIGDPVDDDIDDGDDGGRFG
jgi:hypothetical protein